MRSSGNRNWLPKITKGKIAVLVLILILVLIAGREYYISFRLRWIMSKVESLKTGMTEGDVTRIMGKAARPVPLGEGLTGADRPLAGKEQTKWSYVLLWYRTPFGIEKKHLFVIDVYFDRESRRVVKVDCISWDI